MFIELTATALVDPVTFLTICREKTSRNKMIVTRILMPANFCLCRRVNPTLLNYLSLTELLLFMVLKEEQVTYKESKINCTQKIGVKNHCCDVNCVPNVLVNESGVVKTFRTLLRLSFEFLLRLGIYCFSLHMLPTL